MFSKVTLFTVAAMATFVAAAPAPGGGIEDSCNTGPVQCCKQIYESDSQEANLLASLGLVLGPVGTQVGAQCSPITAIGVGSGSSCTSQPVCCSDSGFNGLVAVGCSPINLNV